MMTLDNFITTLHKCYRLAVLTFKYDFACSHHLQNVYVYIYEVECEDI